MTLVGDSGVRHELIGRLAYDSLEARCEELEGAGSGVLHQGCSENVACHKADEDISSDRGVAEGATPKRCD